MSCGRAPSPAICTAGSPGIRWISEKMSVRIPRVIGIICSRRLMMYCVMGRYGESAKSVSCGGTGGPNSEEPELCGREVPSADLHHGRDGAAERVVPGADRSPFRGQTCNVRECLHERLSPAKVGKPPGDHPVFDQKRAVPGHSSHERRSGLQEPVHVVETGDPYAALGRADQFLTGCSAGLDGEMEG